MSPATDTVIADALRRYIEERIRTRPALRRAFFRVADFSTDTYIALLDDLRDRSWQLAGKQLEVRSVEPVAGHTDRQLDADYSPTWYRNNLEPEHVLVLIQNRRTSDAQSLQDIFSVTATALTTDGLDELINACFDAYQLSADEHATLRAFVRRFGRVLYQPQLRDLVDFLVETDQMLNARPGTVLDEAVAAALPHLGLFRCRDLVGQLANPRGDRLLRQLRAAARIGSEVLDDRVRTTYLERLNQAQLDDDAAIGGLRVERKRELLERFIDGQLRDNPAELIGVLQIDWREIQLIISAKTRVTQQEKLARIADQLETAMADVDPQDEDLREVLSNLRDGEEPDDEAVDRLLETQGDSLSRKLSNELRRLVRTRSRKHADFLAGLTALAVELAQPLLGSLPAGARLHVAPRLNAISKKEHLPAALEVFSVFYGGVEQALPAVDWDLASIWQGRSRYSDAIEDDEDAAERERVITLDVPFRVSLRGPDDKDLVQAELVWQYRSDSPASATVQTLLAEHALLETASYDPLFDAPEQRLRIPVFNRCPENDEIDDLDLRRPIQSLGAWYEQPNDLRVLFAEQALHRLAAPGQAAIDTALRKLEAAWAALVDRAVQAGLFAAQSSSLIAAYEDFLHTAISQLRTGQQASSGYRVLNQAWMIGPPNFTSWVVMPILHPLKLLWRRERARYFNSVITQLLDHDNPPLIVDAARYRRELAVTYGSSQFPPLVAVPEREGSAAARFLPAEEADGYELFVRESVGAEALGLDTDLLAEDENEIAAQRAVDGIVAVLQDYIETYPFVRDGLEIVLFECRNGALPGLLVERLRTVCTRRNWTVQLMVIVHTSSRGAPLFRRVSEWVQDERPLIERQANAYFPSIGLKVIECSYADLLRGREDTDIIILADVLADKGQRIVAQLDSAGADLSPDGYLPTYRAQQEPFEQGELHRELLLTPPQQPAVSRLFLLAQHAAVERRAVAANQQVRFFRELTLDEWEQVIGDLHDHFNWVICYDPTIDRFLMESAFPDKVQIIRYSLGLGAKRQHNLTVSSARKTQDIVERRLAARLGQLFYRGDAGFLHGVAHQLVEQAKSVSGDIVLRAAGPGAFLNELIGLVVARFETERRYRVMHPDALITWILLDDFEHWFSGSKFPDLLFVAMTRGSDGMLELHTEVIEAKCVGEASFSAEARDAQRQVRQGIGRLARTFAAGGAHLDALYWYDQFYRAVIGNLKVALGQQEIWELFRAELHSGNFRMHTEGHSWVFCYDGQVGECAGPHEYGFDPADEELGDILLREHHYGRSELSRALRALVEDAAGQVSFTDEQWDSTPVPVVAEPEPPAAVAESAVPPVAETVTEVPKPVVAPPAQPVVTPPVNQPATAASPPEPPPVVAGLSDAEQTWIEQKARNLERALRQRGVQILPIDAAQADVGPSIVRFKVRLRPNESLRKIQGVAEDLARDLALASTPIIDNVLRSNFVGVDIPRENASIIALSPLLQSLGTPGPAELPIIVGVTPDGSVLTEDLSEFPHLLVAGATNSGKSVFLRSLLLSLMTQYQPGQLELLIVDPKRTDFTFFNQMPYLRGGKVIVERNEARDALLELVREEMPRRQNLIANRSLKVKVFNERFPAEALPPIVALIDEYALLVSMMDKKEREAFEQDLMILAAAARSVGIHLVLATQRPSADIVTSTLKANLDARIAFKVASGVNSRVVLDTTGAENLLGRGDMLFRRPSGELVRLQAPFMNEVRMQEYLRELIDGVTSDE